MTVVKKEKVLPDLVLNTLAELITVVHRLTVAVVETATMPEEAVALTD